MEIQERPSVAPTYQMVIPVLPSDADEFEHANNTCYVHWMQTVAAAHSASLGWTGERYKEFGAIWVVRRHIIDYINPIFPGEELLAETWVPEMKNVFCIRQYRFTRIGDGKRISNAETRWGFVDFTTGRPTRIPSEIRDLFVGPSAQNEEAGNP